MPSVELTWVRCTLVQSMEPKKHKHGGTGSARRFISLGSIDRVVLTGGPNLTLFQCIGLVVIGLCVALGVGVPLIVGEIHLESTFGRQPAGLVLGASFVLLGLLIVSNGVRALLKKRRP